MRTIRPTAALTGVALLAGLLTGCSGSDDSTDSTTTAAADTAEVEAADETLDTADDEVVDDSSEIPTADFITKAFAALSEAIGGGDVQVLDITVGAQHVIVSATDPAAPDELNEWTYRSTGVEDSVPINYGGDTEALAQNIFSLSEVDPTIMADLVANAPATGGIADGTADTIVIKRLLLPFGDDRVIAQVSVEGERSDATIRALMSGEILEVS